MRSGSPWRVCFYPDKCSNPCELADQPRHSPQWKGNSQLCVWISRAAGLPLEVTLPLQMQKSPTEVRLLILYFGSAEVTRAALIYHTLPYGHPDSQVIY